MTDDAVAVLEHITAVIAKYGGEGVRLTDVQRELEFDDDRLQTAFGELFEGGLCNFLPGAGEPGSWYIVPLTGNIARAVMDGAPKLNRAQRRHMTKGKR